MPLELSLSRDLFQSIFTLPASIRDDGVLECTPEGVRLAVVDPARYFSLLIKVPVEAFSYYKCDTSTDFGIPLSKIKAYLKAVDKVDKSTEFKVSIDKARITIQHGRAKYSTAELAVLPDMRGRVFSIDGGGKWKYTTITTMRAKDLALVAETVAAVAKDGENAGAVEFRVMGGLLYLGSKGEIDSMEVVTSYGFNPDWPQCSVFIDPSYLGALCEALPESDFEVHIGDELPLALRAVGLPYEVSAIVAPRARVN